MSENKNNESTIGGALVMAGLFLSIGVATAGYFVGNTLYKSRISANTATVKGLAEREVVADVAVWQINFNVDGAELQNVYAQAHNNQARVVQFLITNGFAKQDISNGALTVNKLEHRDNSGNVQGISYEINGSVALRTGDVAKVAAAQQRIGELLGQGVLVTNSNPAYLFTKLNDIKPEMLGEATRNARIAAEQFAADANASVGKIQSAAQGAFDFSARDARNE
ncbi:MAG: SIMPL domain-containing protein, partial [Alphaproteobacteria bacterium]